MQICQHKWDKFLFLSSIGPEDPRVIRRGYPATQLRGGGFKKGSNVTPAAASASGEMLNLLA